VDIICFLLFAYWLVLLVWVFSSWFMMVRGQGGKVAYEIHRLVNPLVEPVVKPLRGIVPPIQLGGAGLDLSPIILFVVIGVLQYSLC
jgi:YggT family protein